MSWGAGRFQLYSLCVLSLLTFELVSFHRLNMIEFRLLLALFGLFAVLMGLGVAIGLMSLIGLPYIPLHAMLPFVCLGNVLSLVPTYSYLSKVTFKGKRMHGRPPRYHI